MVAGGFAFQALGEKPHRKILFAISRMPWLLAISYRTGLYMRCVVYTKAFGTDRKLDGAVLQKDGVSKCNKSACESSKWLREQLLLKARTQHLTACGNFMRWHLCSLCTLQTISMQSLFKERCRQEFHRMAVYCGSVLLWHEIKQFDRRCSWQCWRPGRPIKGTCKDRQKLRRLSWTQLCIHTKKKRLLNKIRQPACCHRFSPMRSCQPKKEQRVVLS